MNSLSPIAALSGRYSNFELLEKLAKHISELG